MTDILNFINFQGNEYEDIFAYVFEYDHSYNRNDQF